VANQQFLYICVLFGMIGKTAFYFGLQTDQTDDRGIIFSRFGPGDQTNDIRAPANGQAVALTAAHSGEGDFVSVRTTYPWTRGAYEFVLSRRPADSGPGFWADLRLIDRNRGSVIDGGSLRFNAEDATAKPNSLSSFVELYDRPPGILFPEQYRPPPLSIEFRAPDLGADQPLNWVRANNWAGIPHLASALWTGESAAVTLDSSRAVGDTADLPLLPQERLLFQKTKPYRRPRPTRRKTTRQITPTNPITLKAKHTYNGGFRR
jgi:hypothetical protein